MVLSVLSSKLSSERKALFFFFSSCNQDDGLVGATTFEARSLLDISAKAQSFHTQHREEAQASEERADRVPDR